MYKKIFSEVDTGTHSELKIYFQRGKKEVPTET